MKHFLVIFLLTTVLGYGQYWQKLTSLQSSNSLTLCADGNLYSSPPTGGLQKSTDNGKTWIQIGSQFGTENAICPTVCNSSLYVSIGNKISKTTNNGSTWTDVKGDCAYAMTASGNNLYGLNGTSIIKTTDNGATWKTLYTFPTAVYALQKVTCDGSNVYVARNNDGVYRSTNSGTSWQVINNGIPVENIWAVYTTAKGLFVVTGYGNIRAYRSTDNGNTWVGITNGLTDGATTTILESKNGYLLAVSTLGSVFKSTNSGVDWFKIGSGISGIYSNPGNTVLLSDNNILIGTTNGLYKSSYPTDVEKGENIPARADIFTYPNPFNPNTNIKFNVPVRGYVSLSVWNILGEKITTLIDEEKPAGEYNVSFSGKDLPSGIYIVKMNNISKKIVLMK